VGEGAWVSFCLGGHGSYVADLMQTGRPVRLSPIWDSQSGARGIGALLIVEVNDLNEGCGSDLAPSHRC